MASASSSRACWFSADGAGFSSRNLSISTIAAAGSKSWLRERRSYSERSPPHSMHQSRDYEEREGRREQKIIELCLEQISPTPTQG